MIHNEIESKKQNGTGKQKNMKRLTEYFDREGCIDFDLSWAVNDLVDSALKEITRRELEEIERNMACDECEFAVRCNNGDEIYYCDHEDRTDDMGKLSLENLIESSPEWCPLREE